MLLLACLTLPAMARAPCHDGSTGMAGMAMKHFGKHAGDRPAPIPNHDRKAIAAHSCMGCIPPATLQRIAVAAPPPTADVRQPVTRVRFDHEPTAPPATPPPRFDA